MAEEPEPLQKFEVFLKMLFLPSKHAKLFLVIAADIHNHLVK
jgi:hypothetical protein